MEVQIESILQSGQFKKLMEEQITGLRKKYGLKKAEIEILYFLSRCGEHNTSSDIYYQLMMNRGHISQAVDGLCQKHLIEAVPDREDRRYVHYIILDSAMEIVQQIEKVHEDVRREVLEDISEEELKVFQNVAVKIRRNIERLI
ncbi:MAG: MarR family winged helix-turn-helix transcriptional regulator [Anaerovoracaceae bacterium]